MIGETAATTEPSNAAIESKLLLTVEEAAQRLGIGRTVMYRLVSSGAVESVTLGRIRRVPRECLTDFVAMLRGTHHDHEQTEDGAE